MAYVAHVDPAATLGNFATLQALFTKDTNDEGIQGTPFENDHEESATGMKSVSADGRTISTGATAQGDPMAIGTPPISPS